MSGGSWWCPNCKNPVDGQQVTFEERHEGCGHVVEWVADAASVEAQFAALREKLTAAEARVAEVERERDEAVNQRDAAYEDHRRRQFEKSKRLAHLERSIEGHKVARRAAESALTAERSRSARLAAVARAAKAVLHGLDGDDDEVPEDPMLWRGLLRPTLSALRPEDLEVTE